MRVPRSLFRAAAVAFATVLADELARCGLREVVVAPGSRSTPLAMAFWELDRAGLVRLHVRLDERSASFTALGLAKVSRRPVSPAGGRYRRCGLHRLAFSAGRARATGRPPPTRGKRRARAQPEFLPSAFRRVALEKALVRDPRPSSQLPYP